MAIKDWVIAEFDHEMGATRRLLERLPDGKLAWKPHEKSMSLGALGTHLANLPRWGTYILNQPSFDLADAPPGVPERTSRADILRLFEETTSQTRASMDKGDAEYTAPWTLRRSGQEVFTIPRAAAFKSFVVNHIIHHRGQLSVYLRLNDIPVPAIYGPTADER